MICSEAHGGVPGLSDWGGDRLGVGYGPRTSLPFPVACDGTFLSGSGDRDDRFPRPSEQLGQTTIAGALTGLVAGVSKEEYIA